MFTILAAGQKRLATIGCQDPQIENTCCAIEPRNPSLALMHHLRVVMARRQHRAGKTEISKRWVNNNRVHYIIGAASAQPSTFHSVICI